MTVPTTGEEFAKLIEYIRKAQESCATLSHLAGLQGHGTRDQGVAKGWLIVSEQLKLMQLTVTKIGMGKLQ